MKIQVFEASLLPQMTQLVNHHLSAVVPGWVLPMDYIQRHLYHNPKQYVIDPWVIERQTWCAIAQNQVVGAAHLLRYGSDVEIGESYRSMGDIAWVLVWPELPEIGASLLQAAMEQMRVWDVSGVYAWDSHLPAPLCGGVADVWPHISSLLTTAGFRPDGHDELVYGGYLDGIAHPLDASPVQGVTFRRYIRSDRSCGFVAAFDGQEIGWCEIAPDLTDGGAIPGLSGWAELTEMFVHEHWRSKGIGAWLVQHAADWLRLAGCTRIALSVTAEDEARGAGRFYERFGWKPLSRLQLGWKCTDFTRA